MSRPDLQGGRGWSPRHELEVDGLQVVAIDDKAAVIDVHAFWLTVNLPFLISGKLGPRPSYVKGLTTST